MGSAIKPYSESTHFSMPWCNPHPLSPELVWSHFLLSQTFHKFPSSSEKKKPNSYRVLCHPEPFHAPHLPSFISPPTTSASSLFLKHLGWLCLRVFAHAASPAHSSAGSVLSTPSFPFKMTPRLFLAHCTFSPWHSFQQNVKFTDVCSPSQVIASFRASAFVLFSVSCVPSAWHIVSTQ